MDSDEDKAAGLKAPLVVSNPKEADPIPKETEPSPKETNPNPKEPEPVML